LIVLDVDVDWYRAASGLETRAWAVLRPIAAFVGRRDRSFRRQWREPPKVEFPEVSESLFEMRAVFELVLRFEIDVMVYIDLKRRSK
jgi:hypothetical protein